jgi:hypothetical protein
MDMINYTVLEMLRELLLVTDPLHHHLTKESRIRWLEIAEATSQIKDETLDETSKEYFESFPNNNPVSAFSHFEIQSVRDYEHLVNGHSGQFAETFQDGDDEENAVGDVYYSVYGRFKTGGVTCLHDCESVEDAKTWLFNLNG